MKFYFAPLEGLTGYVYRNAHAKYFPGLDKYYTPFLQTHPTGKYKHKELRDITPENNSGKTVVPQILTNNGELFVASVKTLVDFGYEEVNLNLGCPSKTVVPKRRGSGFLVNPDELDRFFDTVFDSLANTRVNISIKTRIGLNDESEAENIFPVYEKYPISELIIHPRTQKDMYKNHPHLDVFEDIFNSSKLNICYNGDICTLKDYESITAHFPSLESVMIGRGLLADPALVRRIKGGAPADKAELRSYIDEIYNGYILDYGAGRTPIGRMKELWFYLERSFFDDKKAYKSIKKARYPDEYLAAVNEMFSLPLVLG